MNQLKIDPIRIQHHLNQQIKQYKKHQKEDERIHKLEQKLHNKEEQQRIKLEAKQKLDEYNNEQVICNCGISYIRNKKIYHTSSKIHESRIDAIRWFSEISLSIA